MSKNLTIKPNMLSLNKASEKNALDLFHKMAKRVPAYRDFLTENHVDPGKIKTYKDFKKHVPIMDKDNYIRKYPLNELCLDGDIFSNSLISSSSGSSGVPQYWPRGWDQYYACADMAEGILNRLEMDKKTTLFIICFSFGVWVTGFLTFMAASIYADRKGKGNKTNIVTPGSNKIDTIDILKKLAPQYEQVVICGYPPSVKDLLEDATSAGVNWSSFKTKLLTCGEGFSEEWRDYVLDIVGSKSVYSDHVSIIGSVDVGLFSSETPLSVLVRRIYNRNHQIMKDMFNTEMLPTLGQYNPLTHHFEEIEEQLVVTMDSGIPLIRYNTKDLGGVYSMEEILKPISSDLNDIAAKNGMILPEQSPPFIYLKSRQDFVVILRGANIYPENIKQALIDSRINHLTVGRFTMGVEEDEENEERLNIHIEMAKNVNWNSETMELFRTIITEKLNEMNSEYRDVHIKKGALAIPIVNLLEYGHEKFASKSTKHNWVERQ